MSIEVNNESGVDVDEAALVALARYVLDAHADPPAGRAVGARSSTWRRWRSCTCSGWTSRARPTSCPSRWTSCGPAARTTRSREPGLLGDVVLCPAVAAQQAAAGRAQHRGGAGRCSARTGSCTCSATTTPSRTRSRRCSGCRRELLRRLAGAPRGRRGRHDDRTSLLVVGRRPGRASAASSPAPRRRCRRISRVRAEELRARGPRGARSALRQVARRPGALPQPAAPCCG